MPRTTREPFGCHRRIKIYQRRKSMEQNQQFRRTKLDSHEILIDNCCNHSLTNSKEDFIEPQVKSNNNAQSEGLQWTQRLNNSGNSEKEVKVIR